MRTIPFVDLGRQYRTLREDILSRFDEISSSGAYILSPEVSAFEEEFAAMCGTSRAVGVASGSDALYLCLKALGIGPGDEVITAPNSFVATAWVIARAGARIVFADVGEDMNLDPGRVEAAITPRTRAIVPVHLTGRVADMDAFSDLGSRHGLFVLEDAAQAAGAAHKGRKAGSFGVAAGFSLHPLKVLHVHGDGGVVTTDDEDLYETLTRYRNHGLENRDRCAFWGMNSRLDAVQAGIARIKLPLLAAWTGRNRKLADFYTDQLQDHVTTPQLSAHESPSFHRYMIRHPRRDALQKHLAQCGVETAINYPVPLHLQPAAAGLGYRRGDFPVAERLADTILSLPLYPEMEDEEARYVVEQIIDFCRA